ncbi:MAG: hypothetical protein NTY19_17900 [Planctomycetota bacterium]|nr:hypothetical protein [Planctomycetota bacterium]
MLIPRFTIRWLLFVTAVCGVFFAIVASALRQHVWAMAVSIGVGSLVLAFLCYGASFGVAYVLTSLLGVLHRVPRGGSPFAGVAPPPQIIPPDELE